MSLKGVNYQKSPLFFNMFMNSIKFQYLCFAKLGSLKCQDGLFLLS